MRRVGLLAIGVLSFLALGCPHDEYRLEMRPTGDGGIERRITGWCEESDGSETQLSSDQLAKLKGLYPNCLSGPSEARQRFAGTFTTSMPSDIGGTGYHLYIETTLGCASVYSERFHGSDDLFASVDQFQAAADHAADILIGWFDSELGQDTRFPQLREFIDLQFRRDLNNLELTFWAGNLWDMPIDERTARMIQYLAERGYFDVEELPSILAELQELSDPSSQEVGARALFGRLQRLVATKMGVPEGEPIPESLSFLASPESLEQSLHRYIRSTEQFQAYCQKIQQEAATQAQETQPTQPSEPDPDAYIHEQLKGFVVCAGIDMFGSPPNGVQASLSLPVKPVANNGTWDEPNGKILWSGSMKDEEHPRHFPTYFYAMWAVPDDRFQKKHFGTVFVEGQDLVMYCLWHESLRKEHAGQWDRFLATLKPANFVHELEQFKFTGPEPLPTTQPAAQIIEAWRACTQPTESNTQPGAKAETEPATQQQ
ncbi:MAG: hypothetical protein MUP47_00960 [Phycisphaerae bacterium]|nr:hypothetical protein [Phycisphaerae bacterium]